MSKAARAAAALCLGLLAAACAAPSETAPAPARASDFRPEQVRQPLVLVRLTLGPGEWEDRDRVTLPSEYQGVLLEALNARAVLAKEVQVRGEREGTLEARAALARARDLGAGPAGLVAVRGAR